MIKSNTHIENIDKLLKGVKSDISANYIHSESKKIIMTNKITITSDLNVRSTVWSTYIALARCQS